MAEPTAGQIALLLVSVALFAAGWGLSLARLRAERESLRVAAKACMYGGLVTGLGVLVWHAAGRGNWLPLADNFDTLVWRHAEDWGDGSMFGKRLTAQRLGRRLATSYGLNSTRLERTGPRGYTYSALLPMWQRMGIVNGGRRPAPVPETSPHRTGATGADGATGAGTSPFLDSE